MCSSDIFLALLALLFPPLAVWVKRGICSADSVINILLCVLGYIPGLLHAWYIIAKFPEPDFAYEVLNPDAEVGRVAYVVVQPAHGSGSNNSRRAQGLAASSSHHVTTTSVAGDSNVSSPAAPKAHENMNYGSTTTTSGPSAAAQQSSSSTHTHTYAAAYDDAGEGRSDAPPPSYAQTVAGDHKIQTQD